MTEQEIKIQEFRSLSFEQKREKLLAIFEFAKDKFDFSETAINYISSNTLPDELVMEKLYEFVVGATIIAKKRVEKERLEQRNSIQNLHKKSEIISRKDSEDADNLLGLIDLL